VSTKTTYERRESGLRNHHMDTVCHRKAKGDIRMDDWNLPCEVLHRYHSQRRLNELATVPASAPFEVKTHDECSGRSSKKSTERVFRINIVT
jgi:hypothetical protein